MNHVTYYSMGMFVWDYGLEQEEWLILCDVWIEGICWDRHNYILLCLFKGWADTTLGIFKYSTKKASTLSLINSKFQQVWPITTKWRTPASRRSTSQPTPHHDQCPTQTSRAHNHKSHPRKHSPTTRLHKNILQHHRGKLVPNKSLLSFC